MNLFFVSLAVLFSIFSISVVGYISMSTSIGPWIELVVALLALLGARFFCRGKCVDKGASLIGLTTVAAGIGGISAVACGFTVPTLYFLDKTVFRSWIENPVHFSLLIAGIILVSGLFAFVVTQLFGPALLMDATMPFPIGQMVARVVGAQKSVKKSLQLVAGMAAAFFYQVINFICGFPRAVVLFAGRSWTYLRLPAIALPFDQFAIFVAIGFIAGEILLIPLLVGMASQLFLAFPIHKIFFEQLSYENFLFAFGAGLVLQEAVFGFAKLPKTFRTALTGIRDKFSSDGLVRDGGIVSRKFIAIAFIALICAMTYFWYFGFSLVSQLYVIIFSLICVYQLLLIGGKTGLAPMGRFATFVMLPGIILFKFDAIQAVLVASFVGLAGSIAVDIMFGRKMGQESGISQREITKYQVLGLVIAALTTGGIFWLLINHFGLGTVDMLAQRSQARAVLVTVFNFDYVVLALGVLFGVILHFLRINTALVFTGLVFPITQSIMLAFGGLISLIARDRKRWEPFWSGVFAAGSLCILLRMFL